MVDPPAANMKKLVSMHGLTQYLKLKRRNFTSFCNKKLKGKLSILRCINSLIPNISRNILTGKST